MSDNKIKGIFLQGKSNTGKTMTLKRVISYFLDKSFIIKKSKNFEVALDENCRYDIWCVIQYQDKTIFIYTMGDAPSEWVKKFIKINKNMDIDICIGAIHNTTYANIIIEKAIGGNLTKIQKDIYIDKQNKEECSQRNQLDAKRIIETTKTISN